MKSRLATNPTNAHAVAGGQALSRRPENGHPLDPSREAQSHPDPWWPPALPSVRHPALPSRRCRRIVDVGAAVPRGCRPANWLLVRTATGHRHGSACSSSASSPGSKRRRRRLAASRRMGQVTPARLATRRPLVPKTRVDRGGPSIALRRREIGAAQLTRVRSVARWQAKLPDSRSRFVVCGLARADHCLATGAEHERHRGEHQAR